MTETDFIIVVYVAEAKSIYVLPLINNDLDFDIIDEENINLVLSLVKDKDNKNALLHKDNKNETLKLLARAVLNNVNIVYTEMSSKEAEQSMEDYTLNNENKLSNFIASIKK
jgi:hypothetical protein